MIRNPVSIVTLHNVWLQALLLAGLRAEEIAVTRAIMDAAGALDVKVLPCTSTMLHAPLAAALQMPEPEWEKPRPGDWTQGGGWGSQRVGLFSGLRWDPCGLRD